jgi:hypothetical protein
MIFPALTYIWDAHQDIPEGPSSSEKAMAVGIPGAGKENMNNSLLDEEKSFIVPLTVIGVVAVVVLLIAGLFIPSAISTW